MAARGRLIWRFIFPVVLIIWVVESQGLVDEACNILCGGGASILEARQYPGPIRWKPSPQDLPKHQERYGNKGGIGHHNQPGICLPGGTNCPGGTIRDGGSQPGMMYPPPMMQPPPMMYPPPGNTGPRRRPPPPYVGGGGSGGFKNFAGQNYGYGGYGDASGYGGGYSNGGGFWGGKK